MPDRVATAGSNCPNPSPGPNGYSTESQLNPPTPNITGSWPGTGARWSCHAQRNRQICFPCQFIVGNCKGAQAQPCCAQNNLEVHHASPDLQLPVDSHAVPMTDIQVEIIWNRVL